MVRWAKKAVALCGAVAVSALAYGAAIAQTSILAPPVFSALDANGVDLTSGSFNISQLAAAIGPDNIGLAYIYRGPSGRDSFAGTVNYAPGTLMGSSVTFYTVSLGGSSFTFLKPSGVSVIGPYIGSSGQSLSYNASTGLYTHVDSDGTVSVFSSALTGTLPNAANGGNIISQTRPNGEVLSYSYKSCGAGCYRLQSVSSTRGYMIKYEYSSGALLSKVTALNLAFDACDPAADTCVFSRNWPSLTFSRAADGSSITITDELSRSTTYGLSGNQITSIQRPGVNTTTIVYNTAGRVTAVSNGIGAWSYTYKNAAGGEISPGYASSMFTTATDPQGHTRVVNTNLGTGQVTSDTNGVGALTSYQYNSNGGVSRIIFPEGNYVNYANAEVRRVAKAGAGLADIVISGSYDATCANPKTCHKPNSVTNERGGVTTYTYDPAHGGVLTATSPAPASGAVQPQTRVSYAPLYAWYKNSAGTLIQAPTPIYLPVGTAQCATTASCAGAADEVKITTSYETGSASLGSNLLPLITSAGAGDGSMTASTTYTYDPQGDIQSVDGPLPGSTDITRYYYSSRQLVGIVGPDPDGVGPLLYRASRTTYDLNGQVTSVETGTVTSQADGAMASFTGLKRVDTAYDSVGRKISESLVTGGVVRSLTQYAYDGANKPICQAIRMNPATFAAAPGACSQGVAGDDGPDRITYSAYDNTDRLIQVTEGYGTASPRVARTMTYTPNGLLATVADANGNLTTYDYDGFDRRAKIRYPLAVGGATSSTIDYEQYSYDAGGNVVTNRRRDGQVVSYTYDQLNRMAYRDNPKGWYYYDNLGRATYVYSGASAENVIANYYDGLGRPSYTYDYRGGTWYPTYTSYDTAGRRNMLQWSDGNYVTYEYNAAGEMIAIRENGAGSGAYALAVFAYDDLGRRTTISRGNGAQTSYGYDQSLRLSSLALDLPGATQDQTWTYAYNPAGQIKSRSGANDGYLWTGGTPLSLAYTPNGLNQIVTAGSATLSYGDARGNLTADGSTNFSYDLDNRLSGVSGGHSGSLSYDPLGRLGQTIGATTTKYVYSGDDLIAELNAGNGIVRRYVPGPGVDEPLVWYEGSGMSDRRWLMADERGSVVATIGASAPASINTYDEYGVPGAGNVGRFQFTGQVWLPEIGLYHYKARLYSPTLGRFMQSDPVGYADGMNWYAYVGNDPINAKDPTGTDYYSTQNCQTSLVPPPPSETGQINLLILTCYRSFYFYEPNSPYQPLRTGVLVFQTSTWKYADDRSRRCALWRRGETNAKFGQTLQYLGTGAMVAGALSSATVIGAPVGAEVFADGVVVNRGGTLVSLYGKGQQAYAGDWRPLLRSLGVLGTDYGASRGFPEPSKRKEAFGEAFSGRVDTLMDALDSNYKTPCTQGAR